MERKVGGGGGSLKPDVWQDVIELAAGALVVREVMEVFVCGFQSDAICTCRWDEVS